MHAAKSVVNKARQSYHSELTPVTIRASESWSNLFMVEDHGTGVLMMLTKQRTEDTELCDLRLVSSDGKELPCHRAVLATQSAFVNDLLKEDRPGFGDEVKLPQRGEDLKTLLDFIYTGALDITERNCWRLYSTVCFFRMKNTIIRDEVFNVLVKLLIDEDENFLKSDDFFSINLLDMPRMVDVLMQAASCVGQDQEVRVLEALGKWANQDLLRRGQFFLEIDQRYQLSLNICD